MENRPLPKEIGRGRNFLLSTLTLQVMITEFFGHVTPIELTYEPYPFVNSTKPKTCIPSENVYHGQKTQPTHKVQTQRFSPDSDFMVYTIALILSAFILGTVLK